jgi:hypothetical protein
LGIAGMGFSILSLSIRSLLKLEACLLLPKKRKSEKATTSQLFPRSLNDDLGKKTPGFLAITN